MKEKVTRLDYCQWLVWDTVQGQIVLTPRGFIIFDDTVLDKNYAFAIERVRSQYSDNARAVKGIGVVTCVYVNTVLLSAQGQPAGG
jgi:hypothetical protein